LIDFSSASIHSKDKTCDDEINFSHYLAPEILDGHFSDKCDIWSTGVISYVLLGGKPPFRGSSNKNIAKSIKQRKLDFSGDEWSSISQEAKDFIDKLLTVDEDKRPSAVQAMEHPWIQKAQELQKLELSRMQTKHALNNLNTFHAEEKLKQATLSFLVSQMGLKKDKEQISSIFRAMDVNNDGKLSREEIKRGYFECFGRTIDDKEITEIFDRVDMDKNGMIDYTEFLVATIKEENLLNVKNLQAAFNMFDKEGKGTISVENIKVVLAHGKEMMNDKLFKQIMREVDENGDGQIQFYEFKEMMIKNLSVST
jgi:calcium-dependent protein kinase